MEEIHSTVEGYDAGGIDIQVAIDRDVRKESYIGRGGDGEAAEIVCTSLHGTSQRRNKLDIAAGTQGQLVSC